MQVKDKVIGLSAQMAISLQLEIVAELWKYQNVLIVVQK